MSDPVISREIGLAILAGFSVLWLALGWWWGRGAEGYEDRAVAGRSVGFALGTATAMATWVTTNTTMTAPQFAYQLGVWGMFGYSLAAIGLIAFAPLATRIKKLMPRGYTSGDFIRTRFGRPGWVVFLGISFFYALGWLVSMGMAGGILLESLTGIDYRVGMVTITVVCTGYTMLGGLRAVIGTDFIQSVLILVGLVIVGVAAFTTVSPTDVHAQLAEDRPALLDLLAPASIMFLFNQLLFGVGEIFHSNVWWSRAHAFREDVGGRAFFWGGVLWLPVPVLAGSVALAAPILGVDVPALDMVGPMVIGELLGTTGAVLILIVVISSLASSLDSLLAATSDLFVEDVYRRLFRPGATDGELRSASLWLIGALGVVTIALCWQRLATLGEVLNLTGAFVASTIWPIAAGLYFRQTNARAATAAMVLGSAAGLTAYFTIGFFTAALISAAVSMVVTALGSLAAPAGFDFDALDEAGT